MHTNYIIYAPTVRLGQQPIPEEKRRRRWLRVRRGVRSDQRMPDRNCHRSADGRQRSDRHRGCVRLSQRGGGSGDFSTEFGLPAPNFAVKYASGTKPPNGCSNGWNGEESLDIEWHTRWRRMRRSS